MFKYSLRNVSVTTLSKTVQFLAHPAEQQLWQNIAPRTITERIDNTS